MSPFQYLKKYHQKHVRNWHHVVSNVPSHSIISNQLLKYFTISLTKISCIDWFLYTHWEALFYFVFAITTNIIKYENRIFVSLVRINYFIIILEVEAPFTFSKTSSSNLYLDLCMKVLSKREYSQNLKSFSLKSSESRPRLFSHPLGPKNAALNEFV